MDRDRFVLNCKGGVRRVTTVTSSQGPLRLLYSTVPYPPRFLDSWVRDKRGRDFKSFLLKNTVLDGKTQEVPGDAGERRNRRKASRRGTDEVGRGDQERNGGRVTDPVTEVLSRM